MILIHCMFHRIGKLFEVMIITAIIKNKINKYNAKRVYFHEKVIVLRERTSPLRYSRESCRNI